MMSIRSFARRIRVSRLICLAGLTLLAAGVALAADDIAAREDLEIELGSPVTPYVFDGDVRDLPAPAGWRPGDAVREIPRRFYPSSDYESQLFAGEDGGGIDPLATRQETFAALAANGPFTVPSRNFNGQGFSGVNPPDTVGDVGPDHYIQSINAGGGAIVRIFNKAEPTPSVVSTFAMDSLGSGNCGSGLGDPIILYDRLAERWMLSEFSSSGNRLCVYISQTDNPVTGGWYNYDFQAPSFPDYPKYGVWPTDANGGDGSYVVTANDGGPGIYALDRGAMLAGSTASFFRLTIPGLPGFGFESPTPADLDTATPPPPNAPAVIMRHRDTENHNGPAVSGDVLEMWHFQVDWNNPGSSILQQQPNIVVSEFDSSLCGLTSFNCFPQPNTGTQLDPLREVIMNRLQYINHGDYETLVGNLVTDTDGANTGGLRWFEVRRTGGTGPWTLHQEGTYTQPDGHSRFMAASAMDSSGNIAIAYNITSSNIHPGLRYTGRESGDPLGVMTQPETVITAGSASNSSNRYGDYASMNLDPADDCTFWFTGEWNTSGSWRTQIASFAFENCGCQLTPDALSIQADNDGDNRIAIDWSDSPFEFITEYRVFRADGGGDPTLIATIDDVTPGTGGGADYTYVDDTVNGGTTYTYFVRASDGGACTSSDSNEETVTATGQCLLAPSFAGLGVAQDFTQQSCTVRLGWAPAAANCAGPVSYSVYRSTTSPVAATPANLIATGLTANTYLDRSGLSAGESYRYLVRATDVSTGLPDTNAIERAVSPSGPCAAFSTVADGRNGTSPLRGDRLTLDGSQLAVDWDVSSCSASGYNLLWGQLADVSSMTVSGSVCGAGGSGQLTWNGVPAGNLFFIMVGTDGNGTESGWGVDSFGVDRAPALGSGECGTSVSVVSATCP